MNRFTGRSHAAIHERVAAQLGPDTAAVWSERFEKLHRRPGTPKLAPVDGLPEALDALTLATDVASSGSHDKMRQALGLTGLYARFAGRIYSSAEVSRGKPAPDLFLHAAQQVGVDPEACVVPPEQNYRQGRQRPGDAVQDRDDHPRSSPAASERLAGGIATCNDDFTSPAGMSGLRSRRSWDHSNATRAR